MFISRFMAKGVLLFFSLLLLGGCGDSNLYSGMADKNTAEAKQDRAVAALSTGDWDEALGLLEELYSKNPDDPAIKKYLASAYVGKAGFDTLSLFTEIALAQENNTEESILFDSVLGLFSDENGDFGNLHEKMSLIDKAIDILAPSDNFETLSEEMSKEQKVQAGLYASMQTILITATVLDLKDTAELDELRNDSEMETKIRNLVEDNFSAEVQTSIERSLTIITVARDELIDTFAADGQDGNDIGEEFDIFLEDIGFNEGVLTENALITYLINTL